MELVGLMPGTSKKSRLATRPWQTQLVELVSLWVSCTWDERMPMLPRAFSDHAKPGIPFPKGKHGQVREAYWPLAQPPSRARIHLQPRLCAYVPVTAVMDFSCHVQDVLFSPLAKTPLRRGHLADGISCTRV